MSPINRQSPDDATLYKLALPQGCKGQSTEAHWGLGFRVGFGLGVQFSMGVGVQGSIFRISRRLSLGTGGRVEM